MPWEIACFCGLVYVPTWGSKRCPHCGANPDPDPDDETTTNGW